MDTPVKKGIQLRIFRSIDIMIPRKSFCRKVLHRLCDTEIHQTDPHSRGKQHRDPRKERILGLTVVTSKLDVTKFTKHQVNEEYDKKRNSPDVNPIEIDKYKLFDNI
ncbi:hypothetical protein D3C81_1015580 [compost metagenome]